MALTARQRAVMKVLWDLEWHEGHELTAPSVGGSEGLRRLREVRAMGAPIEMRTVKGLTTRQYRLTSRDIGWLKEGA